MKYLEFSECKYMSFSAPTQYYYDAGTNTLYEKLDTGFIYAYSPVFIGSWLLLVSDTSNFGFITAGLKPSRVRSVPKGLPSVTASVPMIRMYKVDSSNVSYVGYDSTNFRLYVEYKKGKVYEYDNVTPDMWNALQNVDSKGSWLHWFLKINDGTYPYRVYTGSSLYYTNTYTPNTGSPHAKGYMTNFEKEE